MNTRVKTKTAIDEFSRKVVSPLIADLTRTLEVTCGKTGADNHGSNFIGNGVVLIGIETVAQFINPKSQAELETFRRNANFSKTTLSPEQKKFLQPKYTPDDALGSFLAKSFIRLYFHPRFNRVHKHLKARFLDLIWSFRNPHSHAFYPYVRRQFGGKEVSGGVLWLYNDKEKSGITIEQIENNFAKYSRKLYRVKGEFFFICPQILLTYFRKAIERFKRKIVRDRTVNRIFLQNYERLAPVYGFTILYDSPKVNQPIQLPLLE